MREWPRWCFHKTKGKQLFASEKEMKGAGKGWMTYDEFHNPTQKKDGPPSASAKKDKSPEFDGPEDIEKNIPNTPPAADTSSDEEGDSVAGNETLFED